MKTAMLAFVLLGLTVGQSYAYDFDIEPVESEGRTIFFNSTSSATFLTLLGALLLTGVIAFLVLSSLSNAGAQTQGSQGSYAHNSYYNRNDYENYDPYAEYRSAQNGFFDGMNIVQWISMLQDVYEKFDYNDLDCQKRLICEVMREPEYYGTVAQKFKTGFAYAKYLEVLDLPDDMRELLDEYMDANSRADQQKSCDDFFTCPYSIRDSMKRNIADSNNL